MKTTMKKVLSMTLALVLVLGMLPMAAQATHVHVDADNSGYCDAECNGVVEAGHIHKPGDGATCTHGAICSECGWWLSGLNTANHVSVSTTLSADANGHYYRCNDCGAHIDEAGHEGNRDSANCTEAVICKHCGYTMQAALNHDWAPATCTTPKTCKRTDCGITEGNALGHTWEAATASTGEFCSICRTPGDDGPLGSATVRVCVLMGGTSQNGGSFTITASGTKTANEILSAYLSSSVSTHTASQISSSYVAAEGSATQYSGNQILEIAPNATYVLYLTPVNSTNNTQSNTNGIYVSFVPNYNTYTYATYVAGPLASGVKLYTIPHNISRTGYTLEGWYYDAALTQKVPTDAVVTTSATFYAKWTQIAPYNVSVVIYTNGNKQTPTVTLDLYEWAQDGVITLADLQQAVAKHGIKANNNAGLSVYGPFTPNQWTSYVSHDYFRNSTERVSVNAGEATVLYAMVHNVKITKGTVDPYGTIADKSNPKTGDMIYAPMMVLGLSASALAVLFYLNKKRAF